ncbi:MAG TPA: tetratricopeptide repeat protein [Chroococcales cyanobacterium]
MSQEIAKPLPRPESAGSSVPPSPAGAAEADPLSGSRLFAIDSKAMARLAQGTSVSIASLLAIPDAIALLPNAKSVIGWSLEVLGVWIAAAVLWFVGFLGLMHAVRLLTRGVEVNDRGIKPWRFARLIEWSKVEAIDVEPQLLFTRLFSLSDTASRLTVFELKRSIAPGHKPYLVPHHIPSFLFDARDYYEMFDEIARRKFKFIPNAHSVLLATPEAYKPLRSLFKKMGIQRVLLPIVISLGLVMLLGRKAIVHYDYNSANKEMARGNYEAARQLNEAATRLEPTFAAGWNNLANAEFKLGRFQDAAKHWNKALFYKPDFVEAKISLSYLSMQQRDFKQAFSLIESALNLDAMNAYAMVNRSDCLMRTGHVHEAVMDARQVLSGDPAKAGSARFMAACLLAQGRIMQGNAREALNILDKEAPIDPQHLRIDQNLTFRLLVTAQADRALNRLDEASHVIAAALRRAPQSADLLLEKARIQIAQQDYKGALDTLGCLDKIAANNPWPALLRAELEEKRGDSKSATAALAQAVANPSQDSSTVAESAALASRLGNKDQALFLTGKMKEQDSRNDVPR